MATSLRGTVQEDALKRSAWRQALADSFASSVGGVVPVLPFLFLRPVAGAIAAFSIVLATMLALGACLGRLTRKSVLGSVGKMLAFTAVTAAASAGIQLLLGAQGG